MRINGILVRGFRPLFSLHWERLQVRLGNGEARLFPLGVERHADVLDPRRPGIVVRKPVIRIPKLIDHGARRDRGPVPAMAGGRQAKRPGRAKVHEGLLYKGKAGGARRRPRNTILPVAGVRKPGGDGGNRTRVRKSSISFVYMHSRPWVFMSSHPADGMIEDTEPAWI